MCVCIGMCIAHCCVTILGFIISVIFDSRQLYAMQNTEGNGVEI